MSIAFRCWAPQEGMRNGSHSFLVFLWPGILPLRSWSLRYELEPAFSRSSSRFPKMSFLVKPNHRYGNSIPCGCSIWARQNLLLLRLDHENYGGRSLLPRVLWQRARARGPRCCACAVDVQFYSLNCSSKRWCSFAAQSTLEFANARIDPCLVTIAKFWRVAASLSLRRAAGTQAVKTN